MTDITPAGRTANANPSHRLAQQRRDAAIAAAVAAERERLGAAVRGLPNLSPFPSDAPYVARAAVLALIEPDR